MKIILISLLMTLLVSCRTGSDGQESPAKDFDTTSDWCTVGQIKLPVGQKFSALDGCNNCHCEDQGNGTFALSCTELGCPAQDVSDSCKVDNQILLAKGTKLPSIDGCNTCTCDSGDLSCSELGCSGSNAPEVTTKPFCSVGPIAVSKNEKLISIDGCNSCSCEEDGNGALSFGCTELGCNLAPPLKSCKVGDLALILDGQKFPSIDGCNSCICTDGELECTELGCQSGG